MRKTGNSRFWEESQSPSEINIPMSTDYASENFPGFDSIYKVLSLQLNICSKMHIRYP